MIKIKILKEASSRTVRLATQDADFIRRRPYVYKDPSFDIRVKAGLRGLTQSQINSVVQNTRPYKPGSAIKDPNSVSEHNVDAIMTMSAPKYNIGADNSKATGGQTLFNNFRHDLNMSLNQQEQLELAKKIVDSISQLKAFKIKRGSFIEFRNRVCILVIYRQLTYKTIGFLDQKVVCAGAGCLT